MNRFIRDGFEKAGLLTDHGPIVAVNANMSNPHYEPEAQGSREIRQGDAVLDRHVGQARSTFGSLLRHYLDRLLRRPRRQRALQNVFEVVRNARDRAVQRVQAAIPRGEIIHGFEVDDAARSYIKDQGFGEYFVHRTGHSIGEEVHGTGANMDNLETHDERRIIAGTCFSIEPGVYLPEFGIRSEVNVYVGATEARVTGEVQQELVTI